MKEADKKKCDGKHSEAKNQHNHSSKEEAYKKPSIGSCGDKKGPCSDSRK